MIVSFRHKGLAALFKQGQTKGVQQSLVKRLHKVLALLDTAGTADDMDVAGLRFHALKGDMKSLYSVSVSGNWRIVFRFEDNKACDVDLVDYH